MIRMRTPAVVVTLVTAAIVTARQEKQVECTSDGQKPFRQCSRCRSAETSERKVGPSVKGLLDSVPANERSIRLRIKNSGYGMPSCCRTPSSKELDRLAANFENPLNPVTACV
jgi:hypothetical protein